MENKMKEYTEKIVRLKFEDKLDKMTDILSLFQIAFLKDVSYINSRDGDFGYKYLRMYIADKYKAIDTPTNLHNEVEDLVSRNFINKELSRSIYNGKFITNVYFNLNIDGINNLINKRYEN